MHTLLGFQNISDFMMAFPLPKFDTNNEIKKLTQLIAEPRQDKEFKSKNFVYEGEKRNIPQTVIDKLR